MKSLVHVLLVVLVGGVCAWATEAPRAPRQAPVNFEIPDVLYEINEPDQPVFYRLEALQRPDGSLDTEKLSNPVRRHLESSQEPTAECLTILPPILDFHAGYRPSLEEALATSDWVFVAEVKASAKGFQGRGTPGTLLRVVPNEILKGPSSYGPEHVFMSVVEFRLGDHRFCVDDPEYAPLPKAGDQVLLLVNAHQDNRGTILRTGAYTGIVTLPDDGEVGLPKRYRGSNPTLVGKSSAAFLAWVHRTLTEGGSP